MTGRSAAAEGRADVVPRLRGEPASAEPVETNVFLASPEGEEFAREVLDVSEQPCFLHALCRSDLEPEVTVSSA